MAAFYRPLLLTAAALLLPGLTGCVEQSDSKPVTEVIRPAKIFRVADPAAENIRHFPAEVEANAESRLAFRVSGQIIEFPVKAGNEVKKGQLLARLDPTDFRLRLDDRQARYQLARSQYERTRSLLERKLTAQSSFDEARASLAVAQAALNMARTDMEYSHLRAPFAGRIARVMAEQHENIQAKQTILSLQNRDQVDISIQMPESIVSRVKQDTRYQPTVVFDTHPDRQFPVTIKEYDTQADPATLTYKVVFSLPSPEDFNVLPGMTASVRIDLARITDIGRSVFMLPPGAVFSADDAPLSGDLRHVWKLDPESMEVRRAEVTVGEIRNQGIEVLSGIEAGEHVISAGVHFLAEGMRIRPWNREGGL